MQLKSSIGSGSTVISIARTSGLQVRDLIVPFQGVRVQASTASAHMKDDPSIQNGHAETQFEAEGSLAGFETLEKLLEVPLLHSH